MSKPLTILFSGMIAGDPGQGGATWAVLQYLLGLRRLGHDVYFVEPIKPASIRPQGSDPATSANATYFRSIVDEFELSKRAALIVEGTSTTIGIPFAELRDIARRADLLINVSGMLAEPTLLGPIPRRVYLDLDPAFIQLWHTQGVDMRLDAHTHFVTVGQGIGTRACPIPTCGREWIPTAQPVVLSHWPGAWTIRYDGLTTVGNWRGYGSIEYNGVHYGQKAHSLRKLIELPTKTRERFVLAMGIHPDEKSDLDLLASNKWFLLDPTTVAGTPAEYRRFIRQSKAEFGIAKSGYVVSQSQWFSDRSAAYLASGRPVIAQDTGFGQWLPTGKGVFAFQTQQDVLKAIDEMNSDYQTHCNAARKIAEEHFNSDTVLQRLLQKVGA